MTDETEQTPEAKEYLDRVISALIAFDNFKPLSEENKN